MLTHWLQAGDNSTFHSVDLEMESRDRQTEASSPTSPPAYSEESFTAQRFAAPSQPTSNGAGGGQDSPGSAVSPPLAHGYADSSGVEHEAHIHPDLRSAYKLAAARNGHAPTPNMMPAGMPPQPEQAGPVPGPSHMPAGAPNMAPADMGDVVMADGRRAKRELSQSKRAAQNRAAQRAFRQRKEVYIKKLEQEVREYAEMENNFKSMQAENYALREYIINLQSRLLDAHGEYPQPPPNVNLPHPHAAPQPGGPDPAAVSAAASAGTSLEVVAQAVAGLARGDHLSEGQPDAQQYANRPKEEITEGDARANELPADGLPRPIM